ncbi:MAG TPA: hypothetical protein VJV39_11745 [Dongiaceae bacterium]|nr:hypothetical protein [Dongiaceae bacterium]
MQIDEGKLPPYYTVGYLVSYALTLGLSLAMFVLFAVSDAVIWPAPREALFAGVSVSIAAIIGLAAFALRGHVDPRGVIYGLPDGMTLAQRRRVIRMYILLFVLGVAFLGWFLTLLLPPCALERSCIDFSDQSLVFALSRSIVPFVIVISLGRSIAGLAGYSILYCRTAARP